MSQPIRLPALLACLLLAVATSHAFTVRSGGAAAAAGDLPDDLLMAHFPEMSAWQRCLFVCNFCFRGEGKERDLLGCANSWCLESLGKTGVLPKVAMQMCPAMALV